MPVATVALLDAGTGKPRAAIKTGQALPGDVEFKMSFPRRQAPGRRHLRDSRPLSNVLRLWQCPGGRLAAEMKLPLVSPNADPNSLEARLPNLRTPWVHPAISPDGRVIAVTGAVRAELWDARSGKLRATVPLIDWEGRAGIAMGGGARFLALARHRLVSPDGKTLVAAATFPAVPRNDKAPALLPFEGSTPDQRGDGQEAASRR